MNIRNGLQFFRYLAILLVGLLSAVPGLSAVHEIMVNDPFSFSRPDITIEVGDTVRWINPCNGGDCGLLHDVTADDFTSFQSPTAAQFTFEHTFDTVADFPYHCTIHSRPASAGGTRMNGIVRVTSTASAAEVAVVSIEADDGSYRAGDELTVTVSLENTGDADSDSFNLGIRLSTDTNITADDQLITTVPIENIAAGATLEKIVNVTLPGDLAVGDIYVGANIAISDSDPSNNSNVDAEAIFIFVDFILNVGLNDAWYNPETSGQGFFIVIFPKLGVMSIAWFTYDTELPATTASIEAFGDSRPNANLGDDGHRWLTGAGAIIGDSAEMKVRVTSGGLFDTPTEVVRVDDGTFVVEFTKCDEGTVTYDIPSIDRQGVVPIERVATDNVPLCDALLRELTLNP